MQIRRPLAALMTALALFGVGGMLVGIRVRGQVRRIVVVTAGKLLRTADEFDGAAVGDGRGHAEILVDRAES